MRTRARTRSDGAGCDGLRHGFGDTDRHRRVVSRPTPWASRKGSAKRNRTHVAPTVTGSRPEVQPTTGEAVHRFPLNRRPSMRRPGCQSPPSVVGRRIDLLGHRVHRIGWTHSVHEDDEVVTTVAGAGNQQSGALKPCDGTGNKLGCGKILSHQQVGRDVTGLQRAEIRRSATLANVTDSS